MKKEFGATKNGEKASCYVLKQQRNGGSGIRFWSFFTETLCTG